MYKLTNTNTIVRLHDCANIPADERNADYQHYLAWIEQGNAPEPADEEPIPTAYELEEIKRNLISEGVIKRDALLAHLRWFYSLAIEERNEASQGQELVDAQAKVLAIKTAIVSLENIFNDQRVVNSTNGAVSLAVKQVYLEIFTALFVESQETYLAIKALDPL